MRKIRMGIVGLGIMGRRYYTMLRALAGVEVTALCVRHLDTIDDLPGAKFADYRELFASRQIDAVIIATPHYSHPQVAIEALHHGIHVLVDKPLAVHVADGRRMLAAHCDKALRFGVMFQERSRPLYVTIKAMIQGGVLGEIRRVHWIVTDWFRSQAYYQSSSWRATWKGEGGGLLINQCPHNLDLLQWFVGLPVRVTAHLGLGKYHPIEVEDEVNAFLEYHNGATGVFSASTGEAPGTNRLEIAGEKGKLVLEQGKLTFFENAMETSVFSRTTQDLFARPPYQMRAIAVDGEGEGHAGVLKNFRDAILDGVPLLAPAEEALASLELGNAMLLSGLLHRPVDMPLDAQCMERELLRLASVR
jgi:predicted dehydrogenase